MTMDGGLQPGMVDEIVGKVADLKRAFEEKSDVTTHEFMRLSQARDDLSETLRIMYERCIYKDD